MIENDTIKLLRECDFGIKMGISSIEDVLPHVQNETLYQCLTESKEKHSRLDSEIQNALSRFHDDGKEPNSMIKGMSKIKTNTKLALENGDSTVAELMMDGCDMGIKSLSRYLNQYSAADEDSKGIAKDLILLEETLSKQMRTFL